MSVTARALITPSSVTDRPSIRPPDPAIRGVILTYMPVPSHEATRRLVHLAFRNAHTALDLTHAAGNFWREPYPPGLHLTTNNLDPASGADVHLDFTRTGLANGAYDLVVYDPPHLSDGGGASVFARRFGTVRGTTALREMIEAGALEAWRVAAVGALVKVTDHSHQGELLIQTGWVKAALPVRPYAILHTIRPGYLRDGKHRVERVPRNNGATYLAFRKDGHRHRDFDRMYLRQMGRAS